MTWLRSGGASTRLALTRPVPGPGRIPTGTTYSEQGYNTGMSSSLPYINDWFLMPFFMFGRLPIIYFSRTRSIPEYFERRFNRLARYTAVLLPRPVTVEKMI